jgi:integrase
VRQQRLGHSDPNITLGIYTHVASQGDRRIAAQWGEILRPNAPKLALAEMSVTGKVQ